MREKVSDRRPYHIRSAGSSVGKLSNFRFEINFRAIGGMKPYRKLEYAKEGKDQANDNSDQY